MGLSLFGNSYSKYEPKTEEQLAQWEASLQEWKTKVWNLEDARNAPNLELNPNPDPKKYTISKKQYIGEYLILLIVYPNCTNYEGKKILVFKDVGTADLKKQGSIDPHFCNNPKYASPIARFVPTDEGWEMAVKFCEAMRN